jgi:hypothetical protein
MRHWWLSLVLLAGRAESQETRFEVSFPAATRAESVTGRVYVMISRTNDKEPRLQISQTGGTPLFGRDVDELAPGQAAILDESDLGSPVTSLREIPAGEYRTGVRERVLRSSADPTAMWSGCTTTSGRDRSEISLGNLHSRVQKVRLDPGADTASPSSPTR